MTRKPTCPELTEELLKEICNRVMAGAFEHIAAGSLGVPLAKFLRNGSARAASRAARSSNGGWSTNWKRPGSHARLMAEMDMRKNEPKVWLLHGLARRHRPFRAGPPWSGGRVKTEHSGCRCCSVPSLGCSAVDELLAPYPRLAPPSPTGLTNLTADNPLPAIRHLRRRSRKRKRRSSAQPSLTLPARMIGKPEAIRAVRPEWPHVLNRFN